ncbi:unnamed protein product [Symbiodinium natans]|uniref:Nitronate monooxygenase n=1 Tax=Symbiodinium natans TaxID=878477 RepID=A0A812LBK7_9DINO|nr:unnamed protein product [Symbiodinium natans]
MARASPPALAKAVSEAGGLGLIGGGYGDEHDLDLAFAAAAPARVGVGFITWSLDRQPELLEQALRHKPTAVMLSFGDPAPHARAIKAAGAALFCQCQTLRHVAEAVAAGADVVVAQGSEAGGHGSVRGTMSFVAEVADYLKAHSPSTLLLAAGGIADGRGLAASLMLGADGVLMGSRFWACEESHVKSGLVDAAIAADGDATVRSSVPDIARGKAWPAPFNIRTLSTQIIKHWLPLEAETKANPQQRQELAEQYAQGAAEADPQNTGVIVGEAVGLIHDRPSAKVLVRRIAAEAAGMLSTAASHCGADAGALSRNSAL